MEGVIATCVGCDELVYADALETAGQGERARYVRELVAARRQSRAMPSSFNPDVPRWFRRMVSSR